MLRSKRWPLSRAVAQRLDPSRLIEEENTPFYHQTTFYPARLGETLNNRYQLATKLGYGSRSTVWLARDLFRWRWQEEKYVAVKIKSLRQASSRYNISDEIAIHKRLLEANPRHEGAEFVRKLLDSFMLDGQQGKHECLVFEPLREPLWIHRSRWTGGNIPSFMLKIMLQMVLQALDYLHSECRLIHTDLKPDNIMVRMEDQSLLPESARAEFDHPLPQKHCEDGRIIYLSRNNYGQPRKIAAIVSITDFDLAIDGDVPRKGLIQTEVYRAPEVILNAGFSYSADIWSLGVMLWDLLEGHTLFQAVDSLHGQEYNAVRHLASITALLGAPPDQLLQAGENTPIFFGPNGILKEPVLRPDQFSFESTLQNLEGKDKEMFISFVKRMIRWRPEGRSTAKELLQDPWLHARFDEIP